jgi:hypothetical protein
MDLQKENMMSSYKKSSVICYLQQAIILCILLIGSALVFVSCDKDMLSFPKSTGKNVTITRTVTDNFTKIYLNDNVNLVITQGSTYQINLEGGENLLPGIETNISDSVLTIRNTNTFNWLRSYDKKITAYVTLPHLLDLQYEATSTVTNTDTIREDSLTVTSTGGSGYIDLVIKTGISKLSIINGSVDMKFRGKTGVNFIFSDGYGPFHCLDLQSDLLFMRNSSTNDCYVNVIYHMEYEIMGLGNIYYRGNPPEISGTATGSGKLIKIE